MMKQIAVVALAIGACGAHASLWVGQAPVQVQPPAQVSTAGPAFDVATIKPVEPDAKAGRYIIMQGTNRFMAKHYTLKLLIAAAYDLNPKTVLGGPAWIETDPYDITALTPGAVRPARDEQMAMLRGLLADRFKLTFHREPREYSIYELEQAKDGAKLKPTAASPGDPPALISTVYPDHLLLPARNATMAEFTSVLQRAVLDRPVVDKTGLTGHYDFDLTWAADETQFGGEVPTAPGETQAPPFFTAIEQQLGLKLEATRGPVDALIVDGVERPSAN